LTAWPSWDGAPHKESAIDYGKKLGAERILYAARGLTDEYGRAYAEHTVGFYAKDHSSLTAH
jgi:hypothetical protein